MRIIHFSDFHLYGGTQIARSKRIAGNLIKCFAEIAGEKKVDLVIFSGDLVNKAGEGFGSINDGFAAFKDIVIDPTLKALSNLPAERFIFVPGNHDFTNPDDAMKQDMADKTKDANAVDIVLCDDPFTTTPWMKDFKDFEKNYYDATGYATYNMTPFQSTIIVDVDGMNVGIAMLNSTWRHFSNFDGKVALGKHQVTDAADDLDGCSVKLAVAHHHYSMLEEFERNDVRDAIISDYDIFFSGHVHSDKPMFVKNERGKLLDAITPGIIPENEEATDANYKNGFFVIDYDGENGSNTVITKYKQDSATDNFIVDTDYGENGKFTPETYELKTIAPINQWLKTYSPDSHYMSNDKIKKIQETILNGNENTVQIVALSGFGKTRLIYETFNDGKEHPDVFYCKYSPEISTNLQAEYDFFLNEYNSSPCTIIVDNCSVELLMELNVKRGGNGNIKLISLDNNMFDIRNVGNSKIVKMETNLLRSEVEAYIDDNVKEDCYGHNFRSEIKKISDGFPKMAIDLVKSYHENAHVRIENVEALFGKLLIYPKEDAIEMKNVMQAMALFQPMPYGDKNTAYDFIRNNNIICSISGDDVTRLKLFNRTIRRFEGTLIEIDGKNLVVRPFPLAVWLAGQWFADMSESLIEKLLNNLTDLSKTDTNAYSLLKDGLAMRLEYMAQNEYANELVGKLLNEVNGFFRNEKVVCSDLGSRLFLAMSHVNPVAVGSCLWAVLEGKSAEWIKENIVGDVRRNLVWALEKVCFPNGGFINGAKVLALLSLGENEDLGNNATQIFYQLFHILLSGTAATLEDRFSIITYLKQNGYADLFADAINNAFMSGNFIRTGSAQKFGTEELKDYQPTNEQIIDYWDKCRNIVIESLNDGFLPVERVKSIVEKQAHQWIFRGLFERIAMPLIDAIMEKDPTDWEGLYSIIKQNERSYGLKQYGKSHPDVIEKLIENIRPNHFVTNIKDLRTRIYEIRHMKVEDETKMICEEYSKLAEDFVSQKVYADENEVRLIDEDMEYMNYNFPREIVSKIDDEQLQVFINQFIAIYEEKGDDNVGNFYYGVVGECKDREIKKYLLARLLDLKLYQLYARTLAIMEDEDLNNLNRLWTDISEGSIPAETLTTYINNARYLSEQTLVKLITTMSKIFPDRSNEILRLILNHRWGMDLKQDSALTRIVKQALLEYNVMTDDDRLNYEYNRLCCDILEKTHDAQFAKELCRKMIDVLNTTYMRTDFDGMFSKLLLTYGDEIWDDFSKALADEKHFYFYFNIKDEVGSGFNFGAGALFQIGDDRLKKLCNDNPDVAPKRLATMCPVFDSPKDNSFHPFFLWLLDEYGDNKDVRNNLHANANSFGWTGSVVPLFTHLRTCFIPLQSHPRKEVREWAKLSIADLDKQIDSEKNREAYMRLHYE